MKSPPKETRGEIVALLKKQNGMSAGEIAKKLRLHAMTIRQHLSILERDGYIQHCREKMRRGRPVYMYKLTQEAEEQLFPSSYPQFALRLLDTLAVIEGDEKVSRLLECQMEARFSNYIEICHDKCLAEKIKVLVELLNEEGYMVEVEETHSAYIIKEHNCALGSVAKKYRQLCQYELSFFKRLLRNPVERQCHMASGDSLCSYLVPKLSMD